MAIGDQAERLRTIISDLRLQRDERPNNRIITITSGKGGVGKTNITINLAICLAKRGFRIIILDADFGLSNVDVMLGTVSKYSFVDLLKSDRQLEDILSVGPLGVRFVSGGSGAIELLNMDERQLDGIIDKMAPLDKMADIILVDTGAGITPSVLRFMQASDEVILVVTPEPASLTDAYALVKSSVGLVEQSKMHVIFNRVADMREAKDTEDRFLTTVERFLGVRMNSLGFVNHDNAVLKAVKKQQPFILEYPQCKAAEQIRAIADALLGTNRAYGIERGYNGIRGFLSRLLKGA
ncbi:MinD/ParA family protein [Mahella australiensis]|uniref:Cobyrinic acid a,c-diamide synthase n=1 Tax=Mahella australiensis (strain DSM 15567 / CIP 107919 / 50-1 BON) TaxID=697281 RepID=F4A1V8_MAHA5|nr:MinD/ParA family protein [Mahella australiensis]AEE96074.1 cobyrinic acid a,c-diamide synthase [Mahella australiensis 50-1 BON]